MIGSRPLGRDLARDELRALAASIAERPAVWQSLVRHDPDVRTYEQLLRDTHVAVWLICWMNDHDTGFHDHDLSAGAVAVAAGEVREERLSIGSPPLARTFTAGDSFDFAAADIHRLMHAGRRPAVTINAYSPPLWRMGTYAVKSSGELQRESISYAEELRPPARAACPSSFLLRS
jgi:hypothetical protein